MNINKKFLELCGGQIRPLTSPQQYWSFFKCMAHKAMCSYLTFGLYVQIADGMTLEVGTVNLLIETCGGARSQGGATW